MGMDALNHKLERLAVFNLDFRQPAAVQDCPDKLITHDMQEPRCGSGQAYEIVVLRFRGWKLPSALCTHFLEPQGLCPPAQEEQISLRCLSQSIWCNHQRGQDNVAVRF